MQESYIFSSLQKNIASLLPAYLEGIILMIAQLKSKMAWQKATALRCVPPTRIGASNNPVYSLNNF